MKKILIDLDYDSAAEMIAKTGYQLAQSMNAEVILLHVTAEAFYYSSQSYSSIMGFDGFNNLNMVQPMDFEALNKTNSSPDKPAKTDSAVGPAIGYALLLKLAYIALNADMAVPLSLKTSLSLVLVI